MPVNRSCEHTLALVERHLAEIDDKIAALATPVDDWPISHDEPADSTRSTAPTRTAVRSSSVPTDSAESTAGGHRPPVRRTRRRARQRCQPFDSEIKDRSVMVASNVIAAEGSHRIGRLTSCLLRVERSDGWRSFRSSRLSATRPSYPAGVAERRPDLQDLRSTTCRSPSDSPTVFAVRHSGGT